MCSAPSDTSCPKRFQIVANRPARRVFQTWERRSYVYLATIEAGIEGGAYHVFFEVKRRQRPAGVNLTIESAYRKDPSSYTPPKRPSAIRFGMLIEKVFTGQPLRFD